ncbi:MAG: hypothetical protein ACRCSQ_07700, partial [Bacteroidales bacterium]
MKFITRFLTGLFCLISLSAAMSATASAIYSTSTFVFSVGNWNLFSYDSYAARNFSKWPDNLLAMQQKAFSPSGTLDDKILVMTGYYGYIGHLLDVKKKDQASDWSKKANSIFKKLKDTAPDDPRVLALQSMFTAYDIAISPVKAPFQAGGMMSTAKKALKEAPGLYLANL